MQLDLSEHEAQVLGRVLDSYVKELRGESVERDALMSIIERLGASPSPSPSTITKMVQITAVLTEYD